MKLFCDVNPWQITLCKFKQHVQFRIGCHLVIVCESPQIKICVTRRIPCVEKTISLIPTPDCPGVPKRTKKTSRPKNNKLSFDLSYQVDKWYQHWVFMQNLTVTFFRFFLWVSLNFLCFLRTLQVTWLNCPVFTRHLLTHLTISK